MEPLSPLGCRLRDWNLAARERPFPRGTFRGLILDLDDTLYPLEQFRQSGFMAVARYVQDEYRIPAMEAFATMNAARRGAGAGQELQALCAHYELGERVAELREVFRRHRPLLHLPRETGFVLGQLRASGWRLVVLTNGAPRVQRGKVAALGLTPLVDGVIYADEVVPGGKPAAAAFDAALTGLALPAERCVCVGDNPVCDIAGAQARGLRTVWLAPPGTAAFETAGADARIDALPEVLGVLPRLTGKGARDAA